MELLSINLSTGRPRSIKIGNKDILTGIFKDPIATAIEVTPNGLANDIIADRDRHGGADQAIYLYSAQDYAWWGNKLGREIPFGTFGENITLDQFTDRPLRIGDRFEINDVILEVTFGRVPCATLGARMNDPGFVKQFVKAARCGVYVRVIATGIIRPGDTANFVPTAVDYPTVRELYDLFHAKNRDRKLIQRGLDAPIASRAQKAFRHWLDQSQSE